MARSSGQKIASTAIAMLVALCSFPVITWISAASLGDSRSRPLVGASEGMVPDTALQAGPVKTDGAFPGVTVGYSVSTYEELKAAVEQSDGQAILINRDIDLERAITVSGSREIIFVTPDDVPEVKLFASRYRHFTIEGDISLSLGNVILDGAGSGGGIQVKPNGKLVLLDGIIQSCKAGDAGGAVHNSGTFVMEGSVIRDNRVDYDSYAYGGGVYNAGTFTLKSGEITGNTIISDSNTKGGGVFNKGTFTMENGSITGNTISARTNGDGGGVYNAQGAIFTLKNGSINGNAILTGSNGLGGGVYNGSTSTFTMYDGEINENEVVGAGGGVCNAWEFVMYAGSIDGNSATGNGGGVYEARNFTMHSGTVNGNKSSASGAGVHVSVNGNFVMENGIISGNVAHKAGKDISGGGVYNGGSFIMKNGEVSGNAAENETGIALGGGVYNNDRKTFTMLGGVVHGNTVTAENGDAFGGGIYNGGTAEIQSGVISSNTARDGGGGIYTTAYPSLTVLEDTVFRANEAAQSYLINDADIPLHDTYIKTNQFSYDFTYGYNNFDINYKGTTPAHLYTVTFDTDGGTPVPQDQRVVSGGKVREPEAPTKEGYTFEGWYLDEQEWNFSLDTVSGNITLTALWEEKPPVVDPDPDPDPDPKPNPDPDPDPDPKPNPDPDPDPDPKPNPDPDPDPDPKPNPDPDPDPDPKPNPDPDPDPDPKPNPDPKPDPNPGPRDKDPGTDIPDNHDRQSYTSGTIIREEEVPLSEISLFDIPDTGIQPYILMMMAVAFAGGIASVITIPRIKRKEE